MTFDHKNDIQLIESFVGKECERTLACNSLKLWFGHKKTYIWVDPPWTLYQGNIELTSSDDCPEETDAFKKWSKTLNPLNKIRFTAFEHTDDGNLNLTFNHGLKLFVPFSADEPDEEDFYSHWYASSGEDT
ncbi:MAG: hypothetical protein R8K54_08330 [Mariprofundaceae bacterium]